MKKYCFLLACLLMLLGIAVPALAAGDSLTINAPYLIAGVEYLDYEHNLTDNSALNIAAMHLDKNGFAHELFKEMFGVEVDLNALNLTYKIYPNGAQNGLYYGVDVMEAKGAGSADGTDYSQLYTTLAGPSIGFRKITESGLTFDAGLIGYYSFTEQEFIPLCRLNIGYGW